VSTAMRPMLGSARAHATVDGAGAPGLSQAQRRSVAGPFAAAPARQSRRLETRPAAHRTNLVTVLNGNARTLNDLGRRNESQASADESVRVYGELPAEVRQRRGVRQSSRRPRRCCLARPDEALERLSDTGPGQPGYCGLPMASSG
jgi:hypothetical protein